MELNAADWTELGKAIRICADDAHEGDTPHVSIAYAFLVDQDEYIVNGRVYRMADDNGALLVPAEAPEAFINAYYGKVTA